jgi:hypothetical protein
VASGRTWSRTTLAVPLLRWVSSGGAAAQASGRAVQTTLTVHLGGWEALGGAAQAEWENVTGSSSPHLTWGWVSSRRGQQH